MGGSGAVGQGRTDGAFEGLICVELKVFWSHVNDDGDDLSMVERLKSSKIRSKPPAFCKK
jgi:hypothetical protein